MDFFKKYDKAKLPNKAMFYDKLNSKNVSEEDYLYAISV